MVAAVTALVLVVLVLVLVMLGVTVVVVGRGKRSNKHPYDLFLDRRQVAAMPLDLASLTSVDSFAKRYSDSADALDILVNNAGVMAIPERQATKDGFEMQFGTNHLGEQSGPTRPGPGFLKLLHRDVTRLRTEYHSPCGAREFTPSSW